MTTTRDIDPAEAAELLRRTAENNLTGHLGGPFVLTDFTLEEALVTIDREGVTDRSLCIKNGSITLIIQNSLYGSSHIYINPRPPVDDPWSK